MIPGLRELVVVTVTDPAEAARRIVAMRLSGASGWMALVLVAALNALVFGASDLVTPAPDGIEDAAPLGRFSPLGFFGLLVAMLGIAVFAFLAVGRMMGGSGTIEDMLALLSWLQFMRALVQIGALFLVLVSPLLSLLLVIVAMVWGIWITAHFIDQGHRLGSLPRAFGVMLGAGLGIVAALALVLALVVNSPVGIINV